MAFLVTTVQVRIFDSFPKLLRYFAGHIQQCIMNMFQFRVYCNVQRIMQWHTRTTRAKQIESDLLLMQQLQLIFGGLRIHIFSLYMNSQSIEIKFNRCNINNINLYAGNIFLNLSHLAKDLQTIDQSLDQITSKQKHI